MTEVRKLSQEELEACLNSLAQDPPLEQTKVWADYQNTIPGRSFWGCVAFARDGKDVAYASLTDYETHGYHYLRAAHGPVWIEEPSPGEEQEALEALVGFVKRSDKHQAFMRLAVLHEVEATQPVLSTIPYDATVVLELEGGEEEILSRMKPRGRRDVRKSLREAPITCSNETEQALKSFSEYYEVMLETGDRDGFAPAPQSDYENMLRMLGPDHCRVYAGRLEDNTVGTWSIVTLSGKTATRYYAASRTGTMRMHVSDRLAFFESCELSNEGFERYDLMGIGSEFAPSLMGLNEFKTKFSKTITAVAPDRDVPIKKTLYRSLCLGKKVKSAVQH